MVKKKATEKSDATLADVLNLYIETRLAEGCKPLTVRFYTQLIPRFPGYLLNELVDDVDRLVIAKFVADLISSGQSPKTIRSILTFASSACNFGIEVNGLNTKNPFKSFKKPRLDPHEPRPFTATELKRIFAHLDDNLRPAFWLMASTGARSGEVAALTFQDIDLERGAMTIRKSRWRDQDSTTKTVKSNRQVLLDDVTKEMLTALKAKRQAAETDYVIVNRRGKPYSVYWHKPWRQALAAAQIKPYRRPYVLRSSFASIALQNGVELGWISSTLGHSSIKVTADKYLRYLDETASRNRSKISSALEGVFSNASDEL
jgi:integrase